MQVCQDIENKSCSEKDNLSLQRQRLCPNAQHTVVTRPSTQYLADDKVEDICRHLACSKSWLYKWRDRYDAHNPAWVQERSTRPKHSPTQTPEHVARAIVSLHLTLRHNGTGGGATAIMQALAQQGIEPVPSRRTMYRILRRHHKEVKERGSRASMLV